MSFTVSCRSMMVLLLAASSPFWARGCNSSERRGQKRSSLSIHVHFNTITINYTINLKNVYLMIVHIFIKQMPLSHSLTLCITCSGNRKHSYYKIFFYHTARGGGRSNLPPPPFAPPLATLLIIIAFL